jgi:hypothetical protein
MKGPESGRRKGWRMPKLAEIIPLPRSACSRTRDALPELAAGELPDGDLVVGHVEACPECRAEATAYRRLLRSLRTVRFELVAPPAGAVASVLAALEAAAAEQHSRAVRAAYVGGITAVTAAASAAGVLVWLSRRQPPGGRPARALVSAG